MRSSLLARHVFFFSAALTIAFVGVIASTKATGGVAAPRGTGTPPLASMAAMKDASLVVMQIPALVQRLSTDMPVTPGTVHELASSLGTQHLTVYAWPRGKSQAICLVSTTGGGGCLDSFLGPFDVSITDHDTLGAGDPVAVWGPVTDDVTAIDVTAAGIVGQAEIHNNVAFYELQDATLLPAAVEKVVAHLRDGRSIEVPV